MFEVLSFEVMCTVKDRAFTTFLKPWTHIHNLFNIAEIDKKSKEKLTRSCPANDPYREPVLTASARVSCEMAESALPSNRLSAGSSDPAISQVCRFFT
jgi:hypothetical protein